jgi:methionyl aminopeptidase
MIYIRSEKEIEKLRSVCRLAAETMEFIRDDVREGTTSLQVSEKARQYIESHGARAAFLGYNGFQGAICVSFNDEVVHGIPGQRVFQEGDIIKIDLGTY